MLFVAYHKSRLQQVFNLHTVFAGLVACLGHDLNHEGIGNIFYNKVDHNYSQVYAQTSVMERYHASQCFRLLVKPANNILEGFDKDVCPRPTPLAYARPSRRLNSRTTLSHRSSRPT